MLFRTARVRADIVDLISAQVAPCRVLRLLLEEMRPMLTLRAVSRNSLVARPTCASKLSTWISLAIGVDGERGTNIACPLRLPVLDWNTGAISNLDDSVERGNSGASINEGRIAEIAAHGCSGFF